MSLIDTILCCQKRGRLTPFWVLFKKEKYSGVSIHFVNEEIDSGPIIVQEKYKLNPEIILIP